MIVAIDGPAGTGKSTIARMVADSAGHHLCELRQSIQGLDLRADIETGLDPSLEAPAVEWAGKASPRIPERARTP